MPCAFVGCGVQGWSRAAAALIGVGAFSSPLDVHKRNNDNLNAKFHKMVVNSSRLSLRPQQLYSFIREVIHRTGGEWKRHSPQHYEY